MLTHSHYHTIDKEKKIINRRIQTATERKKKHHRDDFYGVLQMNRNAFRILPGAVRVKFNSIFMQSFKQVQSFKPDGDREMNREFLRLPFALFCYI